MIRFSIENPCPICSRTDGRCYRCGKESTLVVCPGPKTGDLPIGFKLIRTTANGYFNLYAELTPDYHNKPRPRQRTRTIKAPAKVQPSVDFVGMQARFQTALTPSLRDEFAKIMNVETSTLDLFGVGWSGRSWTVPMIDKEGRVCGLNQRFRNGTKTHFRGSIASAGFFIPERQPSKIVAIPEGFSDSASAVDLGLGAVGRISCSCKTADLIKVLKRQKPEMVLIVGDRDHGIGMEWCNRLWHELRPFFSCCKTWMPPVGTKDLRQWKSRGGLLWDLLADSVEGPC